ncbi:ISKra4 family transposase [Gloeobacter morelensis]|uniref:ISKra4 family transposase n=1 Tax=Gloeobacter morelensis TaxID=2907343 RepID=UPI003AB92CC9
MDLTAQQQQALHEHLRAAAEILYQNTPPEQLTSLEGIELAVREHLLAAVGPQMAPFFVQTVTGTVAGYARRLTTCVGTLQITQKQAQILKVKPNARLSPRMEKYCLLVSANVSYQHAEQDIETLSGLRVSHATQQRLVHRQRFALPVASAPEAVQELSVDGGKVRLRTQPGQPCEWRDYKAVRLQGVATAAMYRDNDSLVGWVNRQGLAAPLTCLGDGHDGIWNIVSRIATPERRREILDWYHLKENLYKVEGSYSRLHRAEAHLWRGEVEAAIAQFDGWEVAPVTRLCQYLRKHQSRIVNYDYLQAEQVCSVGSGAVESAVKQIDRRLKLSGAQWKVENVPQVLAHRAAYLNGLLLS